MLLELKVLFFFDIEIESKNYSAAVRLASGASHMGAKTLTEGFSLRSRPPLASLSAHAFCDLGIADIEKLEKSKDNALISSSSGAKAGHSISVSMIFTSCSQSDRI